MFGTDDTATLLAFYRNSQYYEKVSDPLDLSTIEKQILTGHYKTVEAFDTDMLKVFRNAEVCRCPPMYSPPPPLVTSDLGSLDTLGKVI